MFKKYRLRDYDFKLVLMVTALSVIGVMAIGSADSSLQSRQLAGVIAGMVLMVICSLFNYNFILKFYWVMYAFNLALLVAVLFSDLGDDAGGAQRWLEIRGFRFQPSETAKIILILFFAQFIMKHREKLNTVRIIGACVLFMLGPWILVNRQPDLSTSIVMLLIFCVIMFAGGVSWKLVAGVLALAIPTAALFISLAMQPDSKLLNPYQQGRLFAFTDPDKYPVQARQQLNSVKAIASGMLDGKGYKNNEITSVKNGDRLSQEQTDFIFSVIGEEFGFKGSLVVIFLLMGISLECISVSRKAKDLAGTIIGAGMGGLVAFQGFINIGVATFILPNTGLTLPFVSYGLTSLLSLFIGMGVVLNVRLQAKKTK